MLWVKLSVSFGERLRLKAIWGTRWQFSLSFVSRHLIAPTGGVHLLLYINNDQCGVWWLAFVVLWCSGKNECFVYELSLRLTQLWPVSASPKLWPQSHRNILTAIVYKAVFRQMWQKKEVILTPFLVLCTVPLYSAVSSLLLTKQLICLIEIGTLCNIISRVLAPWGFVLLFCSCLTAETGLETVQGRNATHVRWVVNVENWSHRKWYLSIISKVEGTGWHWEN